MDKMNWEQLQKSLQQKLILIGLTFIDENGKLIEQYQTHGLIMELTDDGILKIERKDRAIFQMPYDKDAIKKAAKGEYREKLTGAIVKDPDFMMTWEIVVGAGDNLESVKKYGYVPVD